MAGRNKVRAFGTLYTWLTNILMFGIIMTVGVEYFAPTSWWMTVKKVYVHDAIVGQPNLINIDIGWRRVFYMQWHTIVRRATAEDQSEFSSYCAADGGTEVYPGRKVPVPLSLQHNWFANVPCSTLEPGTYYLETVWRWNDWLINRELAVDSNVFHVLPVGSLPIPGDNDVIPPEFRGPPGPAGPKGDKGDTGAKGSAQ